MVKLERTSIEKILYSSKKTTPFFVDVPQMQYLCFDGNGHPEDEDFQLAAEALFTLSYIIKFDIARKLHDVDYKVNPMEVTWDIQRENNTKQFSWTMMIMQPKIIKESMVVEAMNIAKEKGKNIESGRVYYKKIDFGKCIQCFHLGDYNQMNKTLKNMIELAKDNGYDYEQYTHDIYLNDMRKTQMENYKTIMRIKINSKLI